ncbi:U2 snRNP-associated SURP motif-containing protein [Smittium culicis]|uniref:U2 snRNP-associated SURP motif-containing protein n=1 Tax=Smittium culicis TaxID=133412 RepID=A0A1R1XSJ0_9FUNG|nr:U2 snRNP-associated SURP motif-containing protein [Smittium culicis]
MAAFEDSPGSHEIGDETTTNLYVGNLCPQVNEEMLLKHFSKYGPIGSVKIMWPRKKDEIDRGRNSGFVSFMDRNSAAAALKEMDGFVLMDYEMRVCWGKSVPIPQNPIFVHGQEFLSSSIPSGLPFNAKIPSRSYSEIDPPANLLPEKVQNDSIIPESPEHVYYRWKLFSLLNGDTVDQWKSEMFYMYNEGPIWIPPEAPMINDVSYSIKYMSITTNI